MARGTVLPALGLLLVVLGLRGRAYGAGINNTLVALPPSPPSPPPNAPANSTAPSGTPSNTTASPPPPAPPPRQPLLSQLDSTVTTSICASDESPCVTQLDWLLQLRNTSAGARRCIGPTSESCAWPSVSAYFAAAQPDTRVYIALELNLTLPSLDNAFQMGHLPEAALVLNTLSSLQLICTKPITTYAPFVLEPLVRALTTTEPFTDYELDLMANTTGMAAANLFAAAAFSAVLRPPALRALAAPRCSLTGQLSGGYLRLLPLLQSLDLSGNALSGALSAMLFSAPLLSQLNLSRNLLNGPLPDGLGPRLGGCGGRLDLSNNDLRGGVPGVWEDAACSMEGKDARGLTEVPAASARQQQQQPLTLADVYPSCGVDGMVWDAAEGQQLRTGNGSGEAFPFSLLLTGNPHLQTPGLRASGYAAALHPQLHFKVHHNACSAFGPWHRLVWLWSAFGLAVVVLLLVALGKALADAMHTHSRVAPGPPETATAAGGAAAAVEPAQAAAASATASAAARGGGRSEATPKAGARAQGGEGGDVPPAAAAAAAGQGSSTGSPAQPSAATAGGTTTPAAVAPAASPAAPAREEDQMAEIVVMRSMTAGSSLHRAAATAASFMQVLGAWAMALCIAVPWGGLLRGGVCLGVLAGASGLTYVLTLESRRQYCSDLIACAPLLYIVPPLLVLLPLGGVLLISHNVKRLAREMLAQMDAYSKDSSSAGSVSIPGSSTQQQQQAAAKKVSEGSSNSTMDSSKSSLQGSDAQLLRKPPPIRTSIKQQTTGGSDPRVTRSFQHQHSAPAQVWDSVSSSNHSPQDPGPANQRQQPQQLIAVQEHSRHSARPSASSPSSPQRRPIGEALEQHGSAAASPTSMRERPRPPPVAPVQWRPEPGEGIVAVPAQGGGSNSPSSYAGAVGRTVAEAPSSKGVLPTAVGGSQVPSPHTHSSANPKGAAALDATAAAAAAAQSSQLLRMLQQQQVERQMAADAQQQVQLLQLHARRPSWGSPSAGGAQSVRHQHSLGGMPRTVSGMPSPTARSSTMTMTMTMQRSLAGSSTSGGGAALPSPSVGRSSMTRLSAPAAAAAAASAAASAAAAATGRGPPPSFNQSPSTRRTASRREGQGVDPAAAAAFHSASTTPSAAQADAARRMVLPSQIMTPGGQSPYGTPLAQDGRSGYGGHSTPRTAATLQSPPATSGAATPSAAASGRSAWLRPPPDRLLQRPPALDPAALDLVRDYLQDRMLGKPGLGICARTGQFAITLLACLAWAAAAAALVPLLTLPTVLLAAWPGRAPLCASARRHASMFLGANVHVAGWLTCAPLALFSGGLLLAGYYWGKDSVPLPWVFVACNAACLAGVLLLIWELCFSRPAWREGVCGFPYSQIMAVRAQQLPAKSGQQAEGEAAAETDKGSGGHM